jgi:hypothetical protein
VFAKFDKDGDGVLSFEEFKKMLNKDSPAVASPVAANPGGKLK